MSNNTYNLLSKEGLGYLNLELLDKPNIVHAFSTRYGGASRGCYQSLNLNLAVGDNPETVAENRESFCRAVGGSPEKLVTMKQVHSERVVVVDSFPNSVPEGDALITKQPGIALGVQTADCVPVLLADPKNKIIAAVHAGWRGTAGNLLGKTIRRMIGLGADIESCLVGIGPCIGQCCYQVGEKVVQPLRCTELPWEQFVQDAGQGKWRLDLGGVNRWQAQAAGVLFSNIAKLDLCTVCNKKLFYSYRRDGQTGRMMSVISLKG